MNKEMYRLAYKYLKGWEEVYKPYRDLLDTSVEPLESYFYKTIREIVKGSDEAYDLLEELVYFGEVTFYLDNGEKYVAHDVEELIYALEN